MILVARLDRPGVRLQTLGPGHPGGRRPDLGHEAWPRLEERDHLLEVTKVDEAREARGGAGRHHVTRAGNVVAKRLEAGGADEKTAGVADTLDGRPRLGNHEAGMLGGVRVEHAHSRLEVGNYDDYPPLPQRLESSSGRRQR